MFPSRRPYGALPRAANFPNSGFFTSSHLVNLPVVSRLRGRVCLGALLSAGRKNNEVSKLKWSWAIFGAWFGSFVAFGFRGKCARPCSGDGTSALPWRGPHLLQLRFHHTRPDLQPVWEYSLDRPPYVFARR